MGSLFVLPIVLILSAMSLVSQSDALVECPEGTVNCLIDPCSLIKCVSGYHCVSSYCGGCFGNCEAITCNYNGLVYQPGDTFPATDGCNTCTCTDTGAVGCTKIGCIQCPLYKCAECPYGNVIDSNGCTTCECKKKCGKRQCGADEFCSNGDCCSNDVLTIRCTDPCATRKCPRNRKCEVYCNCSSRCVRA